MYQGCSLGFDSYYVYRRKEVDPKRYTIINGFKIDPCPDSLSYYIKFRRKDLMVPTKDMETIALYIIKASFKRRRHDTQQREK